MKLLAALCLLSVCTSASFALDREAFTVTKYDLDIRVEPEQQRIGARGTITIRNDSAHPQKVVALQLSSSLNWRAIRVAGQAVQFVSQPYASDIDHTGSLSEAVVTLPAEIKPRDSVELQIGYEGVVASDATRLTRIGVPEALAKHTSWDQITNSFTAVRGAGYVTWYPITTESADFSEGNSLFEVTDRWKSRTAASEFKLKLAADSITKEDPLTVLCGATSRPPVSASESSPDPSSSIGCEWKPLGVVTPMFAVAAYSKISKPPLELFILSGHEEGAAKYANAIEPAAEFVKGWFGAAKSAIVIADFADPHAAPFESGSMLMVSMAGEDSKLAGINLVHELVHGSLPAERPWVYEGLAHFTEAMYRQQQGGRQAALDLLGFHRATFLDAEKELSTASLENHGQPLVSTFDETYFRSKAAYVWWMLRDMVGDEVLKTAISRYRSSEDTDSKYVESLIETASKRNLHWFFDDWVYQDKGLPDLKIGSAHPWTTEKGVHFVTLTIENSGRAGCEVPVTVAYDGGEISTRLEVRSRSTATTRIEVPGVPTQVTVNDGSVPESDLTNNVMKISSP